MKRKVRIKMDIILWINAKYNSKELEDVIKRGAVKTFPNNATWVHELKYAEEEALYSFSDHYDEWMNGKEEAFYSIPDGEIPWNVLFEYKEPEEMKQK